MSAVVESTQHQQVVFCRDRNSGLHAIIAIYSAALGPALGGRCYTARDVGTCPEDMVAVAREKFVTRRPRAHGGAGNSDVSGAVVERLHDHHPEVEVEAPEKLLTWELDVYAPCTLGGVLNDATVPTLGARVVCGGANNQLADDIAGFDEQRIAGSHRDSRAITLQPA